jgi:SAM-dependent methyltransferase
MLHKNHPFFPTFEQLMREVAAHPPVLDLGTSRRFAKEIGLVRELFDESTYRAGGYLPDNRLGPDSCDFHCDLHDLSDIADQSAGSVICLEVLEHLSHPAMALSEIFRILVPEGICVVGVPFLSSYHGKRDVAQNPVYMRGNTAFRDDSHEGYGDYWRFTHEGLGQLFADAGFSRVDVWPIDGRVISRLCLFGLYPFLVRVPALMKLLSRFDRPTLGRATTLHFARAIK